MQPILRPRLMKIPEKGEEKYSGPEERDHTLRSKQCMGLSACDDQLIWDMWTSIFYLPALTVADELDLFRTLYIRCKLYGSSMIKVFLPN